MLDVLDSIVQAEFGVKARHVELLTGGSCSAVHAIRTPEGEYVVRLKDGFRDVYAKERWAMAQAAGAGVRVPRVFAVGQQGETSYMVVERIAGVRGDHYQGDMEALHGVLGDYARRVNAIAVQGFGFSLAEQPAPHFVESWEDVRAWDRQFIFGSNTLTSLGVFSVAEQKRLEDLVAPLDDWHLPPRLSHNDLTLDNVMVAEGGEVYLLDWSLAQGLPAPFFEIGNFASWRANRRQLTAFRRGYGIGDEQWQEVEKEIHRVSVLNVLRGIVWAEQEAPQLLSEFVENARVIVRQLVREM